MEKTYVSTFISGFQKLVERNIINIFKDVEIIKVYDGLIIYKTKQHDKVLKLPFINNTYLYLGMTSSSINSKLDNEISKIIKSVKIDFNTIKYVLNHKKYRNFKILTLDKNQPVKTDFKILENLESKIITNMNITLNTKNPDIDFIFLRRTEGDVLFLLKLTYDRISEKQLSKGSLRPELAYLLLTLADIKDTDIVMDPFCGSGSIPKQLVKYFKYNMCFASDIDDDSIEKLKTEYKSNNKKLFIKKRDALDLNYFEEGFINKIITDPPWNIYNYTGDNYDEFYYNMLKEAERILVNKGTMVVLMGNIIDFEKALNKINNLLKIEEYHILVNGKKANVYKLEKNSENIY